jgi:YegS/Rv2252/BmrU family lipid kinase
MDLGRRAAHDGMARVIVVGGDGTVHEAANGLLATGIETLPQLGVVPVGTGNDFARITGTQGLLPAEAVRCLAAGVDKLYDVGLAWGEYFVNSLGLGFTAAVAAQVPTTRTLLRPLVYPAAIFRATRAYSTIDVSLRGDTESYRGGIFCVEVGIGRSAGGGFLVNPGAFPDDGLLDVCLVRPLSIWTFCTRMPAVLRGKHAGLKQVQMMQTSALTVRASTPLLAHFDGESRPGPETIEITLLENRLPVLARRGETSGR